MKTFQILSQKTTSNLNVCIKVQHTEPSLIVNGISFPGRQETFYMFAAERIPTSTIDLDLNLFEVHHRSVDIVDHETGEIKTISLKYLYPK